MANETIVTNIVANANFSSLIANVQKATAELAQLKGALSTTNKALAMDAAKIQQGFSATLRSTGQFSTHFVSLSSDVEKFGKNLDQGKLKLRDYYRTWQDHSRTSGGLIRDLARQQVQLQNAILQPLGRNAEGLMQFNVQIPRGLDATKNKAALLKQEMQIFNKVIQDGGVQLINWGKNTQWAGRQLTVGLTVPITAFGVAASKAFREADEQLVRLTKVYGGVAQTSATELAKVRKEVSATARELAAAYGASYKETIALAADIAATGKQGEDLLRSTQETTRLSILGEVDRQEAMKATLAIQTAFKQSTTELSESINFLNAVENQTSTSLADLVEAIPKAGPVIQSLGGSVQDLALYLTAMKEGGVNASEGANAIKSSLASLINPTKVAKELFQGFGIDLENIVTSNAGNLTGMMLALQSSLDKLDPLSKSKAIEQLFGKFQFARLSALFENLGKEGSQTLQVLDLMKTSTQDLANIASRELNQITESASGKYKRALESLKASLAGVGEQFLNIGTFFINIIDKVVQFANKLPDPIKKLLTFAAGFTALTGPIIMLTGVLANFLGYVIKGAAHFRALFKGGEGWKLLTPEMLAANKAGNLLETTFYSDAKAASVLSTALHNLNEEFRILQARANSGVSAAPTISTVAGQVVMTGTAIREVDPTSKYISPKDTRAYSHPNPVSAMTPAEREAQTIFGIVPGAPKVNNAISNNPQMYMSSDLPKVAGVSAIKGVSTGIVAGEAAKWHAMTGALAMQSEAEIALLKREVAATGLITTSLSDSYQALLPQMSRITTLAATESAEIVAELQASKITVDQARARVVALNRQIEMMMGQAATEVATAQGRTINLTQLPLVDQPAFDPNTGKANMKELTRPGRTRTLFNSIAKVLGVKTYGAPYSIETTRPKRFNVGGDIESFGPNKTVVSGPSSINYDDRFGNVPLGGYVLNQGASLDPRNKDLVNAAPSTFSNSGSTMKAMLTPKETIFGPGIHRDPELYAAVDAANNGYAFGGDISRNKKNYGLNPASMVVGNTLKQLLSRKPTLSAGSISGNPQSMFSLFGISRRGKFSESGSFIGPRGGEIVSVSAKPATATYGAALARMPINPDTGKPHTLQSLNGAMARRGLKGEEIDAYLATLGYMSQGGPLIGTTTNLLNNIIKDPKNRNQILQEIDEQFYKKVAEIKRSGLSLTDSNNPYHSVSNEVLNKYFAPGSLERNYWDQFKVQTSGLNPLYMSDLKRGAGHSSSAGARVIYLTAPDGTKIKIGKIKGSGKDEMAFHSANADWESEYGFNLNLGGNIPGGNIKKGRSKYGIPSLASSAISRLTARWKPQMQFRQPGYQYTLGNQDPLHGPLQIGRTMVPKDRQNDPEWTREVIYRDDRFARQAVLPQFLIGNLQDRGMYSTAQYMSGNKDIMGQMQALGNHPLGPIAAMKTLQRKFTGKLYRGLRLDRTFKGLPQDLIEAIGIARSTGDASGLIGREFIMRRSSWSKSPTIASFFAPGHGVDPNNLVIEAAIKNRNILPAGDLFPDKKFSAPYGQDWSAGSRFGGGMYKSEQEAIFGGKFRVVGFKDGKLQVETVVDGARAKGGPVNANRPYLVGENGPEIFVPRNSGGIIPGGNIVKNRTGYGLPNIPTMPGYETPLATQMGMTPVTQNQSSQFNPYGAKAQVFGMAATVGGMSLGQAMGGNTGMMVGSMLGQVASILPFIIKGTFSFSKILKAITIPGLVITGLIAIGKYLLDLKKKAEDVGKANRLLFGANEKTLGEAGLSGKYKDLSTRLKDINAQLDLQRAKARASYDANTKTGISGLTLTIKQLREETARVKKEMPETLAAFNNIDASKVNQLATSLKSQYVSMGMSVEKATNTIYALISASNKSSQAVAAISSSAFKEIVDTATAAASSVKLIVKALGGLEGDPSKGFIEEINVGIEQMINNLSIYQQSLIGTKGPDKKTELTAADALKKTLEEISKIKGATDELDKKTLSKLKEQNLVYATILKNGESLQSIYAKTAIYAAGLADKLNLAAMSGQQAIDFANQLATYQGVLNDITSSTDSSNPLSALAKLYETAKKAADAASKASKAAAKFDADYYKDKIKAIQESINALEKERNARLKLLEVEQASADFNKSLKDEQIRYQEFLASGDLAAAAQSQLNIKKLKEDRQRELTRQSISDDYEKRIENKQKEIDKLQKILEDAEKAKGVVAAADAKRSAELATIESYKTRINDIVTRNPDGNFSKDDQLLLTEIFNEMKKAGGEIKKAADEMLKNYPSIPSGPPSQSGGQPVGTSSEIMLAKALAAAVDNKSGVFSTAVDEFVKAVNKFAGETINPFTKPTSDQIGASAKIGPIEIPNTKASFMLLSKNGRKVAFESIEYNWDNNYAEAVKKGYQFDGWSKSIPKDRKRVTKLQEGGAIYGPGTATSDSIPAYLSNGEYVIKASSVAKYGTETFDALNAGKFANGGKVSKMGTVDSMIKTAESMLGYKEGKNNDTIFGRFAQKAYDLQSRYIAWCGAFINWAAKNSGVDLASMIWTPGGAQSFMKSGKWTKMNPARGDLAFMDFPGDGVNRISHVGLVRNVLSSNSVSTIEGNTSGSGSQRSGGGVLAKIRQYNMKNAPIVGFGRPSYKPVDTIEYKYGKPEYYGADDAKSDYENNRYTVGRGDTLSGIAAKYGISVKQLMEMNPQLNDPKYMGGSRIFAGTKVNIKKFAEGGKVTNSLTDSGSWIKGQGDYSLAREMFANGGLVRMLHTGGPVGHAHSGAPHGLGMSSMGNVSAALKPGRKRLSPGHMASNYDSRSNWKKVRGFLAEAFKETGRSVDWLTGLYTAGQTGQKNPIMFSKNNQVILNDINSLTSANKKSEAAKVLGIKTALSSANVGSLFLGGALGNATVRTAVGAYGASKGIPGLGTLLPTGSLTYGAKAATGTAANLGVAASIGLGKPFVEGKAASAFTDFRPTMKIVSTIDDHAEKSSVPGFVEYAGRRIPTYSGGPFGHNRTAIYQSGGDDFSELLRSGKVSDIISTTPAGILRYILSRDPKNKKAQSMLRNFEGGHDYLGPDEEQFLTRMLAATSFGPKTFDENTLVSQIPNVYKKKIKEDGLDMGDYSSHSSANVGQNLPRETVEALLKFKEEREMLMGPRAAGKFADEGLLRNSNTQGLETLISSMMGNKPAKKLIDSRMKLMAEALKNIELAQKATVAKNLGSVDGVTDLSQIPMIRSLTHGIKFDKNGDIVSNKAGFEVFENLFKPSAGKSQEGARVTEHWTVWDAVRATIQHGGSNWKSSNPMIVTTLKNLMRSSDNGMETVHSTDSWRVTNFLNKAKVLRRDTSVIYPHTTKKQYLEALKARGLYKDGDKVKPVYENISPESKEILYLLKQKYSNSDLDEIVRMFDEDNFLPSIQRRQKSQMTASEIEKGYWFEGTENRTKYDVDRLMQMYSIRLAQKQIGIDTPYREVPTGSLDGIMENTTKKAAKAVGADYNWAHQTSSLGVLERSSSTDNPLYYTNPVTNPLLTLLEDGTSTRKAALSASLMHTYFGKFGSGAIMGNSVDIEKRVQEIISAYVRHQLEYKQGLTKIKPVNPKSYIEKIRAEAEDEGYANGGLVQKFANGGIVNTSFNPKMSIPGFANGGMVSPTYNIPTNTVGLASNQVPGYNKGGSIHHYNAGGIVVNAAQGQDVKELANHIVNIMDARGARRQSMTGGGITV
jgi:TP901 family phage tail tape measure protein